MAAGMYERIHHHKYVVAVRCEDCGAWIDYQPATYRLEIIRKLTRELSKQVHQSAKEALNHRKEIKDV